MLKQWPAWLRPCITWSHVIDHVLGRINRSSTSIRSIADSRLAPSQWETSLQSNAISHWLGENLESALLEKFNSLSHFHLYKWYANWYFFKHFQPIKGNFFRPYHIHLSQQLLYFCITNRWQLIQSRHIIFMYIKARPPQTALATISCHETATIAMICRK